MYSLRELQKARKKEVDSPEHRIAVLGNCSTQFLSQSLQGLCRINGINAVVFDADYDQIEAQLIDPNSDVYKFHPKTILLWLGSGKLYEEFLDMKRDERALFAEIYMKRIISFWDLAEKYSGVRIMQMNFPEIHDNVMGSFSCGVDSTFTYQIRKLNWLLQDAVTKRHRVFIVDVLSAQIQQGMKNFCDWQMYYGAKMEVSMSSLPFVAKAVVDVLLALDGHIKKCVVCDLDNTLWGGVIAEDGLERIEIGELGRGHVFSNLQRWLKQLREYGIILVVCSKNDESVAREPFEKHEEMVLRLSDISLFVANWDDKATNIRIIQESLNIGMDSIVFLDDNPFERNLVKQSIPDIEVPDLPEDPSEWLAFLQEKNYFETGSYHADGEDRTALYKAEFLRKSIKKEYKSIDDYLESLMMVSVVSHFENDKIPRIAQLTQRSNQFNLRTIRYTEDEIRKIAEDENYIAIQFSLKDKYGNHGLVCIAILVRKSESVLLIDTLLMSCRVLKRSMEEFVFNRIVQEAIEKGYKRMIAEYIPTAKNSMVKDLYRDMGFEEIDKNIYSLELSEYKNKKTFITEGC